MSSTIDSIPQQGRSLPSSSRVPILLGLLAIATVGPKLIYRNEPLDRDLMTYAVLGHEFLEGRPLYLDLWDNKPPAIFATYAASEMIFGYGRPAILILGVIAAIVTMLGVYRAGAALGGAGGLWAAAFWTLMSNDLKLQADQPNTEVFINALMVWFFALVLELSSKDDVPRALTAGILLASASAYKQVALLLAFPVLATMVLLTPAGARRRSMLLCARIATPATILWIGLAAAYGAVGGLRIFWETNVVYSRFSTGGILGNLVRSVGPGILPFLASKPVLAPSALLTILLLVIGWKDDFRMPCLFLLAWIIGTHVAVAAPGKFHAHYFQLWLPPLAVGSGWFLLRIGQTDRQIARVTGAWGLAVLLALELPNYWLTAEQRSIKKFGDQFIQTERLGKKLLEVLESGETLYQWGKETGLFFESRTRPTTGVTWFPPLIDGPLKDELTARTVRDLERSRPDLVVVCRYAQNEGAGSAVMNWISVNYREVAPVDDLFNKFRLLVRAGSNLERRLNSGFPPSEEHHHTSFSSIADRASQSLARQPQQLSSDIQEKPSEPAPVLGP